MSAIIIFAPVIIASWPVISAAVIGAVGAMGYTALNGVNAGVDETQAVGEQEVELELENSDVIGQTLAREEQLTFEKDGVTLTFRRDIRGRLKICVNGESRSKRELEAIGTEVAQKVTQQYMYNRIVGELQQGEFSIVDQEVDENETIKIQIRSWE